MLGLITPTLIAIVAACVCGGTLRGLVNTRVRAWPAIAGAFAVELVLYNPPVDGQAWAIAWGPWVWVGTKLILLAVVLVNARETGPRIAWLLVALGLGLNTLVIVA